MNPTKLLSTLTIELLAFRTTRAFLPVHQHRASSSSVSSLTSTRARTTTNTNTNTNTIFTIMNQDLSMATSKRISALFANKSKSQSDQKENQVLTPTQAQAQTQQPQMKARSRDFSTKNRSKELKRLASSMDVAVPALKAMLQKQREKMNNNGNGGDVTNEKAQYIDWILTKEEKVKRPRVSVETSTDKEKRNKQDTLLKLNSMAVQQKEKYQKQGQMSDRPPTNLKQQVAMAVESRKAFSTSTKANANANANANGVNGFIDIKVPQNLVARLDVMGITDPTPIQKEAIPHAIQGRDVMGLAQTGTGKTLAFGLPLVSQMMERSNERRQPKAIRGLVLAPTRELANQIAVQLGTLTQNTPITTFVVVGGQNIKTQINKLKGGTDLLVATPGRLIDLMDRGSLSLSGTSFLVLDEADLMLDMGFMPSLRKIAKMLPKQRQTMLFSATMAKDMNTVARSFLQDPVRVEVAKAGTTVSKITQELHFIAKADKTAKLLELLSCPEQRDDRAIVFGRTKHGMEKLSKKLIASGIRAGSIHGNKSQPQRDKAIAAFKSGQIKVLVATDVAARGLDIPDVKRVFNFELPNVPEAYVHRIGRTARAGKEGAAIAFCSVEEMEDLVDIQKVTGLKIPVASGTPWNMQDTKREKDKIKKNKQANQTQQREARNRNKAKKQGGGSTDGGNTQRRFRGRS